MRSTITAASSVVALAVTAIGGVEVGSQLAAVTAAVLPAKETDNWTPSFQLEATKTHKPKSS